MTNSNVRPEMERITTPELAEKFIAEQMEALRAQIGSGKVLLALSGGVDSSVVAALLIKAVGRQLECVHVNHGLMRKGESRAGDRGLRNQLGANLTYVDATDRFLDKLAGVADPEQKRKIIGASSSRLRGGGPQALRHRLPRPGHHLSRHRRVRPRQEPPQRRRPARGPAIRARRASEVPL